jgi:hypothetical protein
VIRALALSTAVILAGIGLAGGLFWAFLNTPESTMVALALSVVLALTVLAVLGVTVSAALTGWAGGWRTIRRDTLVRGALAFVPALLFVAAGWFAVENALGWVTARSGEISAWFLAVFDWQDVRPLIRTAVLFGEWLRRIVIPFAALIGLGHAIAGAWQPTAPYAWLPQASAPIRLLLVTAVAALTLWAPVTYALYWMPRGLPATWVEPAIAAIKLATIAVVGAAGLSLIIRLAARLRSDV